MPTLVKTETWRRARALLTRVADAAEFGTEDASLDSPLFHEISAFLDAHGEEDPFRPDHSRLDASLRREAGPCLSRLAVFAREEELDRLYRNLKGD